MNYLLYKIGELLLSISTADDVNPVRSSTSNSISQLLDSKTINYGLMPYPKYKDIPISWLSAQRMIPKTSKYNKPSHDLTIGDNEASPVISTTVYNLPTSDMQHFKSVIPKSLSDYDHRIMILEPLPRPSRQTNWIDWMPDFFGSDESKRGPGPLIGPIKFPGMGNNVYIRQNEPPDEDVNHVVIHLINRAEQNLFIPSVLSLPSEPILPQPQKQQELFSHFTKYPLVQSDRQLPIQVMSQNSWKSQAYLPDIEIKDKRSSTLHGELQMPNQDTKSKLMINFISQAKSRPSNVIRGRSLSHRANQHDRSLNSTESKDPVTFPDIPQSVESVSRNDSLFINFAKIGTSPNVQQYSADSSYGQNNSKLLSKSEKAVASFGLPQNNNRAHEEILGFKPLINYANGIAEQSESKTELSRRQIKKTDHVPLAKTVNSYSSYLDRWSTQNHFLGTDHFNKNNDFQNSVTKMTPQRNISILSIGQGEMEITSSPNLPRNLTNDFKTCKEKIKTNLSGSIIHNIMSMTANQTWKNIISRSLTSFDIMRGIKVVIENSTKLKKNITVDRKKDNAVGLKKKFDFKTNENVTSVMKKGLKIQDEKKMNVQEQKDSGIRLNKDFNVQLKRNPNIQEKKDEAAQINKYGNVEPEDNDDFQISEDSNFRIENSNHFQISTDNNDLSKKTIEDKQKINNPISNNNISYPQELLLKPLQKRLKLIIKDKAKEKPIAEVMSRFTNDKISKSDLKMKDAIERIMNSFTQWRHKSVTIDILKDLNQGKEKKIT